MHSLIIYAKFTVVDQIKVANLTEAKNHMNQCNTPNVTHGDFTTINTQQIENTVRIPKIN